MIFNSYACLFPFPHSIMWNDTNDMKILPVSLPVCLCHFLYFFHSSSTSCTLFALFCSVTIFTTQRNSYKNIVKWKNHLIVMFCSSKLNKNHPWGNISYQSQRATSNNEEKIFRTMKRWTGKMEKKLQMYFQCSLPAVVAVIFYFLLQSYNMLKWGLKRKHTQE